MSLNIRDLVLNELTLNPEKHGFKLLEIRPYYDYVDGVKQESAAGNTYTVVLYGGAFHKFSVKVEGLNRFPDFKEGSNLDVKIVNLNARMYQNWDTKEVGFSFSGDDISLVKQ